MRTAPIVLLLALAACRTGSLDEGESFDFGPVAAADDVYFATPLVTNLGRIGIFKKSSSRKVCAWIVLAQSSNHPDGWTTPMGWQEESASINTRDADCFTQMPFATKEWPAEGKGTVTFVTPGIGGFPCALSIHAEIAADKSANGQQKPVDVSSNERFDKDSLIVANACGD